MASQGKKTTQRKLTAILRADVVGYSRLMGDDEEATVATLTAYRKVFTSSIPKFRGREMSRVLHEISRKPAHPATAVGV